MSFDAASYVMGRQAAGSEPTLETLRVTENGSVSAPAGVAWNQVEAAVQPPLQAKTVSPTTQSQTVEADAGNYGLSGVTINAIALPALADDAGPGDIRYGKALYDRFGSTVTGTLENIHQPVPVYWDADNKKFSVSAAIAALINATIALDGAATGYLVNETTSIPVPVVLHPSTTAGKWTLTGGVTTGQNDDKYAIQARIDPETGLIEAEATYYIRAVTTLSRKIEDWGPEYISFYLRV
ncbi:MAG: hypothetical protein IKH03_00010 [Oscillospiraceae bacterium]|nr:hypothetical protein [Oscillospiraceae bacterium]